jgi:hypothetical protein
MHVHVVTVAVLVGLCAGWSCCKVTGQLLQGIGGGVEEEV